MTTQSSTTPAEPEFACTLDHGAAAARQSNRPVQLWYADDEHFAEVSFFRDMVLHAEIDGISGVAAVVTLLTSDLRFAMNVGVWPRECTITTSWDTARIEAATQARPSALLPSRRHAQRSADG